MISNCRSVLILLPLLGCSHSSNCMCVRPPDITSSTLEIGEATFISGSLNASWRSVIPAPGESCEESRWLAIGTGGVYGPVEAGEVRLEVELAVSLEFESGASASMPTVPIELPLVYPAFQIVDRTTGAYSAFSGGSASWFDSGDGILTFSLSGSELCEFDSEVGEFSVCGETEATLTMVGAVFRADDCYEGVAGSQFSPDGAPLCVFEGRNWPSADSVDCERSGSAAP